MSRRGANSGKPLHPLHHRRRTDNDKRRFAPRRLTEADRAAIRLLHSPLESSEEKP